MICQSGMDRIRPIYDRVTWNAKGNEELFGWSIVCLFNGDSNRFIQEFQMSSDKIMNDLENMHF